MADDRVLELRIHGVNNTSPESTLGLDPGLVEKTAGDALGSFWRPTAEGREKSSVPDAVEREAYSWGGMSRSSLGSSAGIGLLVRGAARVGWSLLLPFGLVNVAYWTRRFDQGPPDEDDDTWTRGHGAASLRIAGLLITLLLAVTTSVIALDLVAVQCYVVDPVDAVSTLERFAPTKLCSVIPPQLDFLTGLGEAGRLAVLGAVPMLLVFGLLGLSAATRTRYEQPDPGTVKVVEASNTVITWPALATKGFWSHRAITSVTARLHVAATAALVSVTTAWHFAFGAGKDCDASADLVRTACWRQVQQGGTLARVDVAVVVAGLLVLALVVFGVVRRSDYAIDVPSRSDGTRPTVDNPWTDKWPLPIALGLFAVQTFVLARVPAPDTVEEVARMNRRLAGTSATPAILLVVLLAIGLSAMSWRASTGTDERRSPVVLGVALVVLAAAGAGWHSLVARIVIGLLVIAIITAMLVILKRHWQEHEAWGGAAPSVFLLLAMLMAMLLSSAVATAVGNWLNGANSAASLADGVVPTRIEVDPCTSGCTTLLRPANLEVPLPYMWFGALCLPIALLFVGVLFYAWWKSNTWSAMPARSTTGIGSAVQGFDTDRESTIKTRRKAAFAHRAEPLIKWLVVIGTTGMIVALAIAVSGYAPRMDAPWFPKTVLNVGMWLLAAGGVLVIGLAVGGAVTGGSRPLGLAWDLMCFLPRAGHPLAPPCYAERVIPELSERCDRWLGKDPTRSVVLSAHSLGSVLAFGVILSPRITDTSRISLLAYGSQLRAYFSRIFPELLGPNVLGTTPCLSSRLDTPDPWQAELDAGEPTTGLEPTIPGSVRNRLWSVQQEPVPRWRSLWRRTDYLGFPVWSYDANEIDRRAEEVVTVGYLAEIQTHGDYPRADAYRRAFRELTGLPLPRLDDAD